MADRMYSNGIVGIPLVLPRSRYDISPMWPSALHGQPQAIPGISNDFALVLNRRDPCRTTLVDLFSGRNQCHFWYFLPEPWHVPLSDFCQMGPFVLVCFETNGPLERGLALECHDLLVIDAWTRTQIVMSMARSYFAFLW